jgi:hypothetical protein
MAHIEITNQDRADAIKALDEWITEMRAEQPGEGDYFLYRRMAGAIAENIARDLGDEDAYWAPSGYQLARFQLAVARREAALTAPVAVTA